MKKNTNVKKESVRNLYQYRNMTDEEFDIYYANSDSKLQQTFDERINEQILGLSEDYEIKDLKYNDNKQLEDLATAMVTLNDLQLILYKTITSDDVTQSNIALIEKLNRVVSITRSDISKIQDDLKLSRKIRQSDKEESISLYIESLIKKAKHKYEDTLSYIYCPKCKMLLCNAWFLYPHKNNKITLVCNRNDGDEDNPIICGHKFTVTSKELMKLKGHSIPKVFPNQ